MAKIVVISTLSVGIMLARIKLELPAIRRAILELDDEKLSTDELKAISKQLPTAEEVGHSRALSRHRLTFHTQMIRIKEFGDVSKLSKADQFFSQVWCSKSISAAVTHCL